MAVTNDQFPSRMWFDANNPGPLHDALRGDYATVRAQALTRPSLRRHMESCPECAAIAGAVLAPPGARKRLKLALTPELMHRLLRLPDNYEIVHMFSDNDPNMVFVLVAGEGLPEVPDDQETPIGRLDDRASGDIARDL